MDTLPKHFVYSTGVVALISAASKFWQCIANIEESDKHTAIEQLSVLLPELYLLARYVKKPEAELDGMVERHCTEMEYEDKRARLAAFFGDDDAYLDLPVEEGRYSDIPTTYLISEQLADIYQEVVDLASNYAVENTSVMNDAVLAFLEALDEHWGAKLLSVLRALEVLRLEPNNDAY